MSAAVCLLLLAAPASATPSIAADTGKDCDYCHVTPGGPLTPEGQAYKDTGALPTETTAGPATTGTSTEPGSSGGTTTTLSPAAGGDQPGGPAASGPLLDLPDWVRTLLQWAHLVAVVAWLGAIFFVHVVQTPKVAGRGIPQGYLKLAWPSIAVLGISGVVMTAGIIPDLGTLTDGRWGRLLLTKIAIYLLLASVAALATFVISPRLRRLSAADIPGGGGQEQLKAEGRVTFSYQGTIYDVSGSRLWKEGRHAKRHPAWMDLTDSLGGAPHGQEVFERFPVVSKAAHRSVPPIARLFMVVAYLNLFMVLAVLLVVAAW